MQLEKESGCPRLTQEHMKILADTVVSTLAAEGSNAEDLAADKETIVNKVLKDNIEPTLPNGVTWDLFDTTVSLLVKAKLLFEQEKLKAAAKVRGERGIEALLTII